MDEVASRLVDLGDGLEAKLTLFSAGGARKGVSCSSGGPVGKRYAPF